MEISREITQEILLHCGIKELISFYSTCHEIKNLCISLAFWKEKFRRKGLLLLEMSEEGNLSDWLDIYLISIDAKRMADNLDYWMVFRLDMKHVDKAKFVSVPEVNIKNIWKRAQRTKEYLQKKSHKRYLVVESFHDSYINITPSSLGLDMFILNIFFL